MSVLSTVLLCVHLTTCADRGVFPLGSIVQCRGLRRQKNSSCASFNARTTAVSFMNNSFCRVIEWQNETLQTAPNNKTRIRLRWLGNECIGSAVKIKYVRRTSRFIVHHINYCNMRIKIRSGVAWRTCKALLGRASIKVLGKHALHVRHTTPDLIFIRI